jgi:hypothetical protein
MVDHQGDWPLVASALLRGVSDAPDRETALSSCRAAAARLRCRRDVWLLGTRLSDLGGQSPDRREKEIAAALAMCIYKTALPFNPLLPYAAFAIALLAGGAAVLLLAIGEIALGAVACLCLLVLLSGARALFRRVKRWPDDQPVEPPGTEDFLQLRCIRSLPDGGGLGAESRE